MYDVSPFLANSFIWKLNCRKSGKWKFWPNLPFSIVSQPGRKRRLICMRTCQKNRAVFQSSSANLFVPLFFFSFNPGVFRQIFLVLCFPLNRGIKQLPLFYSTPQMSWWNCFWQPEDANKRWLSGRLQKLSFPHFPFTFDAKNCKLFP